jgi:hypothetical protein
MRGRNILFSILVTLVAGMGSEMLPQAQGVALSRGAASTVPGADIRIEMRDPNLGGKVPSQAFHGVPHAEDTAADGLFPGRWFTIALSWESTNLADQDLHFSVEVSYQHPYLAYYADAPTPISWNPYVTNCTHDEAGQKFD